MAKKKTESKKKTELESVAPDKAPRRLKQQPYEKGRFQKRQKHPGPKLSSSRLILRHSLGTLKRNKKYFGGILFVYAILSLLLVRGFGSTVQLGEAKATLQATGGNLLSNGSALLSDLFSSSNTSNPSSGTYQSILFLVMSLVIIWALRQVTGKETKKHSVKAAFYNSMYPLIPFVLVLAVISLQMVPFLVGTTVYALVVSNGLAVNALEKFVWASGVLGLAVWSLYMITGSVFALYIVTLPNVKPMQALRSSKELVKLRRWTVMRKLLFLPLVLLLIVVIVMLPVVLWLTIIAEWVFFVVGLSILIIGHSYLYHLYRELL